MFERNQEIDPNNWPTENPAKNLGRKSQTHSLKKADSTFKRATPKVLW